jgi:hypothetical protein
VMFRRKVFDAVGGYAPDVPLAADYDLWTRMATRGSFITLSMVGMLYRVHEGNISHSRRDEQLRSGKEILDREVSAHLSRDLTERELEALLHLWHGRLKPGSARAASVLTREVLEHARDLPPTTRREVRAAVATRFIYLAILGAYYGHYVDAVRHVLVSLRWHPVGLVHASRTLLELLRFSVAGYAWFRGRGTESTVDQIRRRFLHTTSD